MKGMGFVLKSLGIDIPEETQRQLEAMIPQIPGILTNAVKVVNETLTKMDERQRAVEDRVLSLENMVTLFMTQNAESNSHFAFLMKEVLEELNVIRSRDLQRTDSTGGKPNGLAGTGPDASLTSVGTDSPGRSVTTGGKRDRRNRDGSR